MLKPSNFYLYIILLIASYGCYQKNNTFKIQEGDLLFQDLDSSSLCDGIEKVTQGYNNMNFSHIGIVTEINNANYVLEAFNGVDTIKLEQFLSRSETEKSKTKVVVGRVKEKYRELIPKAINYGINLIGLKYDEEFKINNNKFYCSELIYEIFLIANDNKIFFDLEPMTFKTDGKTLPIWINYFDSLNIPIPENQLGINPGGISLSEKIEIIYDYNK